MKTSILILLLLAATFVSLVPASGFAKCNEPFAVVLVIPAKNGGSNTVYFENDCASETPERPETLKPYRAIAVEIRRSNNIVMKERVTAKTWPEKNQDLLAEKLLKMEMDLSEKQSFIVLKQIAPTLEKLAVERDAQKVELLRSQLRGGFWQLIRARYPKVNFENWPQWPVDPAR